MYGNGTEIKIRKSSIVQREKEEQNKILSPSSSCYEEVNLAATAAVVNKDLPGASGRKDGEA